MLDIFNTEVLKDESGIYKFNDLSDLSKNVDNQKSIYDSRTELYSSFEKKDMPGKVGFKSLLLCLREMCRWVKKVNLHEGAMVLDIGCNVGEYMSFITSQNNINAVGVDLSIEALKVAKIMCPGENVNFINLNLQKLLPFKDNSFDSVICMDVLEHLENPELVIGEIYRILKPKGKFLFHIPVNDIGGSTDWFYQFLALESFNNKMDTAGHDLKIMKSKKELEKIISKSNLKLLKSRRYNSILQTFFDYHMTHRLLNRIFYLWKVPFKMFHLIVAPILETLFLFDRILYLFDIGSSALFYGEKPEE